MFSAGIQVVAGVNGVLVMGFEPPFPLCDGCGLVFDVCMALSGLFLVIASLPIGDSVRLAMLVASIFVLAMSLPLGVALAVVRSWRVKSRKEKILELVTVIASVAVLVFIAVEAYITALQYQELLRRSAHVLGS